MIVIPLFILGYLLGVTLLCGYQLYQPNLTLTQYCKKLIFRLTHHDIDLSTSLSTFIWGSIYGFTTIALWYFCIWEVWYGFWVILIYLYLPFSLIDIKFLLIPDALPFIILLMAFILLLYYPSSLINQFMTVLISTFILWLPREYFLRIHDKEALGWGDIKLMFGISWILDLIYIPLFILLSSSLGLLYHLFISIESNPKENIFIPFGPCLLFSLLIFMYIQYS